MRFSTSESHLERLIRFLLVDWEYPATDVRGGRVEDTANLVLLAQELRAAFGTKYGLSSILAPDYWYLRGMEPKAMEPYLDFFGFMAYDLHGFWDADVKTLGSIIRPQTDIREIDNNTLPLWFDKLDPAKVNLGLAYYGRGYTVTDRSSGKSLSSSNPKRFLTLTQHIWDVPSRDQIKQGLAQGSRESCPIEVTQCSSRLCGHSSQTLYRDRGNYSNQWTLPGILERAYDQTDKLGQSVDRL